MWRFVWRVSRTLCYQHLCDEHKHSLRGLVGVGWQCVCVWGGGVTDGTVSGSLSESLRRGRARSPPGLLRPAQVPSSLTQGERPDWTRQGAADPRPPQQLHNSGLLSPFVFPFFLPLISPGNMANEATLRRSLT